ncbi:MAG: ribonuclease H-like domain-containing protein [Eubacteriales bacterium]|nr:ribonuclease H-like domain-containing protein [Eubacteriales bacterium]
MRIITKSVGNRTPGYPLEALAPLSDYLFLDIETTGLSADKNRVYLIGCLYHEPSGYKLKQWFADEIGEEGELLSSFLLFAASYRLLVHYNGNQFDLPFLKKRLLAHGLPDSLSSLDSLDLYQTARRYRRLLGLADCRQQTLEAFLGSGRTEARSGGDLVEAYAEYVREHSDGLLEILLAHNEADIKGLLSLVPLVAYRDLFSGTLSVYKAQANYYDDYNGSSREEVLLFFTVEHPLPKPLLGTADHCFVKIEGTKGLLKVPLLTAELKYFYANYKDYYYFPLEDQAIHKSIASFAERDHREQATPSTCYTRKIASFLPQWDLFRRPFFKRSYEDRELFFEMSNDLKQDRAFLSSYATYVLRHIGDEMSAAAKKAEATKVKG